jgi:hypothetical protein
MANGRITDEHERQVLGDLDAQKAEADRPTALRLNLLASEAYRRELLSEGQLARLLHLDRIELREILELEGSETDGIKQNTDSVTGRVTAAVHVFRNRQEGPGNAEPILWNAYMQERGCRRSASRGCALLYQLETPPCALGDRCSRPCRKYPGSEFSTESIAGGACAASSSKIPGRARLQRRFLPPSGGNAAAGSYR